MSKRNSFSNITHNLRTPCPGLTPSTQQRHHTTLFNLFHPMISLVCHFTNGWVFAFSHADRFYEICSDW
jgi:hypothetical protein